MPRTITFDEAREVGALRQKLDDGYTREPGWALAYEGTLNRLIALARPEMLAAWQQAQEPALFDTPLPSAPLSPPPPGADGAAASNPPAGGGIFAGTLLDQITYEVMTEIQRAVVKFPTWPTRIIDAGNIVSEEAGELAKACLQLTYEPHKETRGGVRGEAVQTAAMCIRFLLSMEHYDCTPGPQHEQGLSS